VKSSRRNKFLNFIILFSSIKNEASGKSVAILTTSRKEFKKINKNKNKNFF
jgi:hypothetical protein